MYSESNCEVFHIHPYHILSQNASNVSNHSIAPLSRSDNSGDSILQELKPQDFIVHSAETFSGFDLGLCSNRMSESNKKFQRSFTDGDLRSHHMSPPRIDHPKDVDPMTPTANLKLLLKALSPDIRFRDQQEALGRLQNERTTEDECYQRGGERLGDRCEQNISRKDKSLALLCKRFLKKYPSMPPADSCIEISLDDAAEYLGVGRRRVYDIINVLEAVQLTSRFAKNTYLWHGKTNLKETLQKLKAVALTEGLDKQIEELKLLDTNRTRVRKSKKSSSNPKSVTKESGSSTNQSWCKDFADGTRKSLNSLSQKFVMMFLVAQPQILNLDLCTRVLVGPDQSDLGKFKTTIRRLYDIANIMTSLDLIQKVQIREMQGKKPAYRYIGPEIDDVNSIIDCGDISSRPALKTVKRVLSKHLSFDHMCKAAALADEEMSMQKGVTKMQKHNSSVILNPVKAGVLVSSSLEENDKGESRSTCESEDISKSSDFHGKPESPTILNAVPNDATDVTLVPVLDETTKRPLTLMIPNSKSGIQIFRTRSENAVGQTSLNALKFVLTKDNGFQAKDARMGGNLDEICPLKKRVRLEATDPAEEVQSEKKFTYLRVTSPEPIRGSSSSQSMTDLVVGGCDHVTEAETGSGVLSQGRSLTNLFALPVKCRRIQTACGKENVPRAVGLNVGQFGLQKLRPISDLSRHSGLTFPLFSSFKSGPMTEIQYGAPSPNASNLIHNHFSNSSTSSTAAAAAAAAMKLLTAPSSITKFGAEEQNDRIASLGCPVVSPMGFTNGTGNVSPTFRPKLIFLRRLPSGGGLNL